MFSSREMGKLYGHSVFRLQVVVAFVAVYLVDCKADEI